MSVYAEIVGYMPTGKFIQDGYDYNCIYDSKTYKYSEMPAIEMYQKKLFDIIIYRITYTNIDGKVYEYSARQVHQWCSKNGLHSVNELYYGYAKDLFNINLEDNWHENFINKLREQYLEKDSILCNNKVPEEGIVIRKEVDYINVYKLKSLNFLINETKSLDKGIISVEDIQ